MTATLIATWRLHLLEVLGLGVLLIAAASWLAAQIDDDQFRTVTLVPLRYEATVIQFPIRVLAEPELHDCEAEGWL